MSNIILLPNTQDLRTPTFNYKSKEFFVNLSPKDIPTLDSSEWDDFIDYEEYKCTNGVNVNGVFFPGSLYFHLNHWQLLVDVEDEYGNESIRMQKPNFRDNDWVMHNAIYEAEKREKGIKEREMVIQGGCRQIGKTVTMASIISRDLAILNNVTDLIVCSSQADIDAVTKYIFAGMDNLTWFLRVPRITKNVSADEFLFGHKDREGNDIIKSKLLTRNSQGGSKTQVAAGTTIYRGVFDEIGKAQMLNTFEALKPAMRGKFGFRSAGLLTFTGGEVEKSKDAELAFYNPKSIDAREFDFEGRKTGLFLSGLYRQDLKKLSTVGEEFNLTPTHELYNFPYEVRDEEYGRNKLQEELAEASKSNNISAMVNHRIFQPMITGDMFLTPNKNPFPVDALARHRENLLANPIGTRYDIYRGPTGKVELKPSYKKAIHQYPILDKNISLDTPVMIYSLPKYTEYYNLHVLGVDAFNQDFTQDGDSLGSIYVMRRVHSDLTDNFQDCIVASYTGRTTVENFDTILELLQELYNGEILFEDSQQHILPYFERKNKAHVLMDTFDLQRELNPKTRAGNKKGLKSNSITNGRRLGAVLNYLNEDLGDGVLGLTRIPDPLLIDEMIAFNGLGEGSKNTDRLDAFGYTLLQLQSLQKFLIYRPFIVNREEKPKKKEVIINNAFGFSNTAFKRKTRFGF